ncbi:uncharacterized protein LOC113516466 [Galleria mellonella]|uniref:Uncharacterized protein LOC113516466 n=1 Tax=Galleria mellonella TaxID=7137 RepID=A0A6J1WVC7_GALME|nr:uncharacterized protein LOC113516466 [Galleria mellonella]
MYRLIILLTLLISIESHRHCGRHTSLCHRRHHDRHMRNHERSFDSLARSVISLDRSLNELCTDNNNNRSKEIFKTDEYTIQVSLEDYAKESIVVKIKYRVLYIYAEKKDESKSNYFELRVLPEIVDVHKATWNYNDGDLEIIIQYKMNRVDEYIRNCEQDIDSSVIVVENYEPVIDLRKGIDREDTTEVYPDRVREESDSQTDGNDNGINNINNVPEDTNKFVKTASETVY